MKKQSEKKIVNMLCEWCNETQQGIKKITDGMVIDEEISSRDIGDINQEVRERATQLLRLLEDEFVLMGRDCDECTMQVSLNTRPLSTSWSLNFSICDKHKIKQ